MNKGKSKESAVRISLLDVMYGVVLTYGFVFFDQASMRTDYILFFLAYAIIIVDWIYVHSLYWGWEYKYNSFLILDIGILFTMSRLLSTSTTGQSPFYWLWLSVLFAIYVTWGIVSKRKGLLSEYDWRYGIGGDLFATIAFLVFYILLLKGEFQPTSTPLIVGTIIVYSIAVSTWFKKLPQPRADAVCLIRRIEVADIRAVHSIDSQIFSPEAYPRFFFRQAYELYRETFLVASLDGVIIGYCLGAITAQTRDKGWILSLAVSSNHRGRGYGSRLLSKTLEALLEIGCNEVLLSVQLDNNIAKALFQRHAFKTIQVDSEYFGPGHPREIMRVLLRKET